MDDYPRYVIEAKFPETTPKEKVLLMLQSLLAERFALATHRERRMLPVYTLVTDRAGPKIKRADTKDDPSGRLQAIAASGQVAGSLSIAELAAALSLVLDRPVVDMTHLEGVFAVSLNWTPDEGQRKPVRIEGNVKPPNARTAQGDSVFSAIHEQLGLRLHARKAAIDVVVVDHVEKVPTEN